MLRDIFRVSGEPARCRINKFIQSSSPAVFLQRDSKYIIGFEALQGTAFTNFVKSNIIYDFGKDVTTVIANNSTDYILIDLADLRFRLATITTRTLSEAGEQQESQCVVSQTTRFEELLSMPDVLSALGIVDVHLGDLPSDDEMMRVLDKYAAYLKSIYEEKQIIIVEVYPATQYIDDLGGVHDYKFSDTFFNACHFHKFYAHLKEALPQAKVIPTPPNSPGWAQHQWGKGALPFVDDYYLYLYQAILLVLDGRTEEMKHLYQQYESLFRTAIAEARLAQYIAHTSRNLLRDVTFSGEKEWVVATSKDADFCQESKQLRTGHEQGTYCVLRQTIDKASLGLATYTLSLKYCTHGSSALQMLVRRTVEENGSKHFDYVRQKSMSSYDRVQISQLSFVVDDVFLSADKIEVLVFINSPDMSASVMEIKLGKGEVSSLIK